MKLLRKSLAACILSISGAMFFNGPVAAQGEPIQLLDTVTVSGRDFAIRLNTDGATPGFDTLIPQDSNLNFADCVSNPLSGLTCLNNDNVRHYSNPIAPTVFTDLFSCGNPALPFNTRKGNGCSAIDRDTEGAIYLGGALNGNANIVIKVIADTGAGCSAPFASFTGTGGNFCWKTIASGRPRIEDIDVLEGGHAEAVSDDERALLILEERKTVLIYSNIENSPEETVIDEIASGKQDFGLNGNEQIQNVMLMEHVGTDNVSEFFVVVATDAGRIISLNADGSPSGVDPLDVTALDVPAHLCPVGDNSFNLAQGPDGGLVYITIRNSCVLHALPLNQNASFTGFNTTLVESVSTINLPPLSISVFPGIGFDLENCVGAACTLISSNGDSAASLELPNNGVVSVPSGVVLFHETGIPHCAWIPQTCAALLGGPASTPEDAVEWLCNPAQDVLRSVDPAVACEDALPQAQVLNVTPFLSEEITDQIELTGQPAVVPPLLFPPEYRAQLMKFFFFDLLAFVPEPGVETDGVLTLDLDVDKLTGTGSLGCGVPPDDALISWDVNVRASERWRSPDASYSPAGANFQGTLTNADCFNPTRNRSGGISIFPVDFELTPCPVTENSAGAWVSDSDAVDDDGDCNDPEFADDAVFAKLFVKLFDELRAHLNDLACTDTDSDASQAPLSSSTCATLDSLWLNAKDKLSKGLLAVTDGSSSSPNQNFQAFIVHFDSYRDTLQNANTLGRPDPANRVGEQAARLETLDHLWNDKVIPSIEAANFSFIEDDDTWAQHNP